MRNKVATLTKLIKTAESKLKELRSELRVVQKECNHDYNSFVCVHCKYSLLDDLDTNAGFNNLIKLKTKYICEKNKSGLEQIKLICAFQQMLRPTFPVFTEL